MHPEVGVREKSGISGETAFQSLADLALQLGPFIDQIASMTDEKLQGPVARGPGMFEQAEAVDGRAEDGDQIVIIGLEITVFGRPIMAGSKGVYKSGVEAGVFKGSLDNLVVGAGHLDTRNGVLDAGGFESFADQADGQLEFGSTMLDRGGRHENLAIEVTQHPLGSILGTIDADNAEVLRPDLLHAGLNDARRLSQDGLRKSLRPLLGTFFTVFNVGNHDNCLSVKRCSSNISHKSS